MAQAPPLEAGPDTQAPLSPSERARRLLYMVLTDEQAKVLTSTGYIPVVSNRGDRWRISTAGPVGNCESLDSRIVYCAHLPTKVRFGLVYPPYGDHYLAQMLAIETDVDAFLRRALLYRFSFNWHPKVLSRW